MVEDFVKRPEFNQSIGRLFEEMKQQGKDFFAELKDQRKDQDTRIIDIQRAVDVNTSNIARNADTQALLSENMRKMYEVVWGNGKPGLITRIAGINTNRWLIGLIVAGLGGICFFIIREGLSK